MYNKEPNRINQKKILEGHYSPSNIFIHFSHPLSVGDRRSPPGGPSSTTVSNLPDIASDLDEILRQITGVIGNTITVHHISSQAKDGTVVTDTPTSSSAVLI